MINKLYDNMTEKDEGFPEAIYTVQESPELLQKLRQADVLKDEINNLKSLREYLWPTIDKKIRIDWTYDSNAIEGSTLSRSDTIFFLDHGLTVKGKPLKDFLDARNHANAIDFLYDVITDKRQITPGLIKEINALLLLGIEHTPAMNKHGQKVKKTATPGEYKKLPNSVLCLDGTIHHYVDPIQVPAQMDELTNWIENSTTNLHPLTTSAIAHYNMVRIHPFDDGNGRGARILMNLILMKNGFTPAIIQNEHRDQYIISLEQANKCNINPFVNFVADSMLETQKVILENLKS